MQRFTKNYIKKIRYAARVPAGLIQPRKSYAFPLYQPQNPLQLVYFLDNFQIRQGVVISRRGGVWLLRTPQQYLTVWEDDIFLNFCNALRALNTTLQ